MAALRRILIVEDTRDDGALLSHVIEMILKYQAALVETGEEALRIAQENRFDLVLLDMFLPRMPGWEVADALRQMPVYTEVPIIAVTAFHDVPQLQDHFTRERCDCYLPKPVNVDELLEAINALLPAG